MNLVMLLQRTGLLRVVGVEGDGPGPRWDVELQGSSLVDPALEAEVWDHVFRVRDGEQREAGREVARFVGTMLRPGRNCVIQAVFEQIEGDGARDVPVCGRCPACRTAGDAAPVTLRPRGLEYVWPPRARTVATALPSGLTLVDPEDTERDDGLSRLLRRLVDVGIDQFLVPGERTLAAAVHVSCARGRPGLVLSHDDWLAPESEACDLAWLPTAILLPGDPTIAAALLKRCRAHTEDRPDLPLAVVGSAAREVSGRRLDQSVSRLAPITEAMLDELASGRKVEGVAANGGELSRDDAQDWLNPGFLEDGQEVREKTSTFGQTLGAATSLGAVRQEAGLLRLEPSCVGTTFANFCDWVHERLVTLDSHQKDAVVLETYSYVSAESHRQGSLAFVHDWTAKRLADEADKALPDGADDDGERRINPTKLPTWRRWLDCLGLSLPLPGLAQSHPSADARLAREIPRFGLREDAIGAEVPARDFLQRLAQRLPYLDGGVMFAETSRRIGHAPSDRQLSPLLSASLRNLHDEGVFELRLRGDAGTVVRLWPEPSHRLQTFHAVHVPETIA